MVSTSSHLQSITLSRASILLLLFLFSGCKTIPFIPGLDSETITPLAERGTRIVSIPTFTNTTTVAPSQTSMPIPTTTLTAVPGLTMTLPVFEDWEIAFTALVIDDPKDPINSSHREVRTIRLNRQEPVRLVENPHDTFSPKWSPDGKQVAYLSFDKHPPSLYITHLETGQTHEIENVWRFDWSKDGQEIVYCEYGSWPFAEDKEFHYYLARTDEPSNSRVLLIAEWRAHELQWSPSGDRILVVGYRQIGTDLANHIYIVDLEGNVQELTTKKVPQWHAAWHPDGDRIAYASDPETYDEPSEIRMIDLRTFEEQEVTHIGGISEYPEWSPDGKKLTYESSATLSSVALLKYNIYILDLDTGKTERLVGNQGGHMMYPTWSPDGKYLAFIQGSGIFPTGDPLISESLNIYELETSRITTIVSSGVQHWAPAWKTQP